MVDNPYKYPYVPVGGIIEWDGTGLTGAPDLSTPEKVAAVYGYGTWERYGTDRVTVGAGGDYTAGSTGGEKEHILTVDEMAEHKHGVYGTIGTVEATGNIQTAPNNSYLRPVQTETASTGGSKPHNNMQPFIAAYRYRRIA